MGGFVLGAPQGRKIMRYGRSGERIAVANLTDLKHCTPDRYNREGRGLDALPVNRPLVSLYKSPHTTPLSHHHVSFLLCTDCILHPFSSEIRRRVREGTQTGWGGKARLTKKQHIPSVSSPAPPPPLRAQRREHGGDIETDISLLDERGISVTQVPRR